MSENEPRLLIVEDDLELAEMLNAYFLIQGYDVQTVNWGEDCLRACQAVAPDLIILDIRLPDIDGYEVAHRLRSDRRTANIPILFLTEKRQRADRLQGLELGADDYITKPFDIQELKLRVRNNLRRKSMGSLTNPITGLAERELVDERLNDCLSGKNWNILIVHLEHLERFREAYGFVASDDVVRAISLMIQNAAREAGSPSDFVGHLSTTQFIIMTDPERAAPLANRIQQRLEQTLDYFYPVKDREAGLAEGHRLRIHIGQIGAGDGPFLDLDHLKTELIRRR